MINPPFFDYLFIDSFLIFDDFSLNERHRTLVEGGIPPVTYDFEKQKWAQKQRFGNFGVASGVDIRTLWPTVEVRFHL